MSDGRPSAEELSIDAVVQSYLEDAPAPRSTERVSFGGVEMVVEGLRGTVVLRFGATRITLTGTPADANLLADALLLAAATGR